MAEPEDNASTAPASAADAGAVAVADICTAVAELRLLRAKAESGDDDVLEKAMAAKQRLAEALGRATSAGVPQDVLLESSALQPGDQVEIYGLESEGGKKLNGQVGIVTEYVQDRGRFQVELVAGSNVSIRPTQLRRKAVAESESVADKANGDEEIPAEALKLGYKLRALPEKSFEKDGVEYFKEGDVGTVMGINTSKSGKDLLCVLWSRTGQTTNSGLSHWRSKYELIERQEAQECDTRMPEVGEIVLRLDGKEIAYEEWVLNAGDEAVVADVDEDGDFKLRNPRDAITENFIYRTGFIYKVPKVIPKTEPTVDEAAVFSGEACDSRTPQVGDLVLRLDGQDKTYGEWILEAGEEAYVVEVDEDGDFKLRSHKGAITANFIYTTGFGYKPKVGRHVEISGLTSDSGIKLNGRVGVIIEFVFDKDRFKIEFAPTEIVSVKPANLTWLDPIAADAKMKGQRTACTGDMPANGAADKRSKSPSSGSSSSERPKKKAKRNSLFDKPAKKRSSKNLTPEEKLEKLLQATELNSFMSGAKPPSSSKPRTEYEDDGEAAARSAGAAAAAKTAAAASEQVKFGPPGVGDKVEVFGLLSEGGKKMNGKTGMVTKWVAEKGRFQVELGLANVQSIRPENLKKVAAVSSSAATFNSGYIGPTAGYTML